MGNGGGHGGYGLWVRSPAATRPGLGARRRAPRPLIISSPRLNRSPFKRMTSRSPSAAAAHLARAGCCPSWTQPLSLDLGQNGEIAFLLWSWTSFSSFARRTGQSADVRPGREALREYSGGTPCRSIEIWPPQPPQLPPVPATARRSLAAKPRSNPRPIGPPATICNSAAPTWHMYAQERHLLRGPRPPQHQQADGVDPPAGGPPPGRGSASLRCCTRSDAEASVPADADIQQGRGEQRARQGQGGR
jgi:hypothetical protein